MTGTSVAGVGSVDSMGAGTDANWKIRGAGEFNFDGVPDVIWNKQDTGAIYVVAGSTGFPLPNYYIQPLGPGVVADVNWQIAGTGDFNRDGSSDVVWQHQTDGRIAVWTMQGTTLVQGIPISPARVADLD